MAMILRTCGLLAFFAATTGCSTTIDLSGTPEAIRPFAVSALTEPTALPEGADLMPLRTGRWEYRLLGDHEAEPFVECIEPADSQIAPYRQHSETLGQVSYLSTDERGRVLLHGVEDHEHAVLTRFVRPLVIYDPGIGPGQTITTKTEMTLADLGTPEKIKDRGPCAMDLTYIGRQRLRTPAGERDCYVLQRNYRVKLKFASVSSETVAWCADGQGVQAQLYKESGRALVVPWFKHHGIVLVESPSNN